MFSHYVNSKGADCLNLLQVSSSASKKGRPKDVSDYDSKSDSPAIKKADSSTKSDPDAKVRSKRKKKQPVIK